MNWHGASEFFAMGGYGLYVWGAYGLTAALLAIEPLLAARRQRRAVAQARCHHGAVTQTNRDHDTLAQTRRDHDAAAPTRRLAEDAPEPHP